MLANRRDIGLGEGEIAIEASGDRLGVGVGESSADRAVEVEPFRREEQRPPLLILTVIGLIPRRPPAEHTLDTQPMADLQGRGQGFRVFRERRLDYVLAHPVTRLDDEVWVTFLLGRRFRQDPHVELPLSRPLVGRETMVELVEHLRFVQWQVPHISADVDVPLPTQALA